MTKSGWRLAPHLIDKRTRRPVRSLLVALAITGVTACGPTVYANPKGCRFDESGETDCSDENDAGSEANDAGPDGGAADGGA